MMQQTELIEKTENMTLVDKLHKLADTFRNCQDIKQCIGYLIKPNALNPKGVELCAYGAMAFRAGESYDDIRERAGASFMDIAKLYGFTQGEYVSSFKCSPKTQKAFRKSTNLSPDWSGKTYSLSGIVTLNDSLKYSFEEIADEIDYWATQVK